MENMIFDVHLVQGQVFDNEIPHQIFYEMKFWYSLVWNLIFRWEGTSLHKRKKGCDVYWYSLKKRHQYFFLK